MDRNFSRSLAAVLRYEGGYVNNPKDPGGPTNLGVTLENFRRYVKPDGTIDDLKALTRDQAGVVFRRHYWDVAMCSDLPDGVDLVVFDWAVNSGPKRAIKALQRASAMAGLADDGIAGPKTIAAAKMVSPSVLINAICDARVNFLKGLSTFGEFGHGWLNRVADVRTLAMTLAEQTPEAVRVEVKQVPVPSHEAPPPQTVAVVPKGSDKRNWLWWPASGLGLSGLVQTFTDLPPVYKVGVGVATLALVVIILLLGDRIIRRAKALRDEINAG